jgi:hypothetical protein
MAFKDAEERRAYFREYNKGWYRRHKKRLLEKRRQHNEMLRHRDRTKKSFTISSIASRATSIKQLTDEIEKCDVVCVNCHVKRHWREKYKSDSWEDILDAEGETNEHHQDKADS